jgi:hypothetical protein
MGRRAGGDSVNDPARRRKIVALILSGIFPGLGQFYNRQPVKGGAFVVAGVVLSWLSGRALPPDLLAPNPLAVELVVVLCVLLAVWLWSVVDAWRLAGR